MYLLPNPIYKQSYRGYKHTGKEQPGLSLLRAHAEQGVQYPTCGPSGKDVYGIEK